MSKEKEEFIGKYLNKKMKDHGLPYGMEYLNKLADAEEAAEKSWKLKSKKVKPTNQLITLWVMLTVCPSNDLR